DAAHQRVDAGAPFEAEGGLLMRRGFGLMQAIVIVLVVGGIMMLAMRYARLGAVHTADSYAREQAELFLQSATEIAMLQISGHDRSGGCLERVSVLSRDRAFRADIRIVRYYLLADSGDLADCGTLGAAIGTEESHGMVVMEAVVTTDPAGPLAAHPVRIVRRSLQRPLD
ncbi:hypothetical protein, partial [Hydrogenimonas sp.]